MNEDLKYWICLDLDKRYTLKTKLEHLEKEKNIIKVCEKLHINLNVNFNKYIEYMQKNNIYCIPISYKEYPKNLRRLRYPPIIIYAKGNYSLLNEKKMIAVIGARNCSNYGKEIAKKIGKYLAENNINVVSGLAMGIDVFSHIGCINENITNKNSGKAIAIIGNGLDNIYPYQNREIAKKIINNDGCIISEYIVGTKPLKNNFPARNRLISALADKLVVVEAENEKSGTMITVDFSLDLGKEIYVVPGNITSKMSKGTNKLIKTGANIITEFNDIID